MLFVWRGSVLFDIAPQLLLTTGIAIVVTVLHGQIFKSKIPLTFVPFSLIGLTLAVFLGFRNNTSYARYWEARSLWGGLLNESRSLARQALTLVDEREQASVLINRLIAFTHALRHQLRGTDPTSDLRRLLSAQDCERLDQALYKPAILLLMAGEWLQQLRLGGKLSPVLLPAMEVHLGRLCEVLGGCERIANTPIPFTYGVIIHRIIYFYCWLLPFGLVDSVGSMTPLVVMFVAYTFFALEALSAQLEEPFGLEPNDLALNALSWTIENSLRDMQGEKNLIAMPQEKGFILD